MSMYQAVYDAVRSRITGCDAGELLADVARSAFDISYAREAVLSAALRAAEEAARPSAIYRPKLHPDGDMWCALYGENLQEGCAGFGKSPELAMADFDANWQKCLAQGNTNAE